MQVENRAQKEQCISFSELEKNAHYGSQQQYEQERQQGEDTEIFFESLEVCQDYIIRDKVCQTRLTLNLPSCIVYCIKLIQVQQDQKKALQYTEWIQEYFCDICYHTDKRVRYTGICVLHTIQEDMPGTSIYFFIIYII